MLASRFRRTVITRGERSSPAGPFSLDFGADEDKIAVRDAWAGTV
jgi:hypothetical protein